MDRTRYTLSLFGKKTPSQVESRITNTAIHNLSSWVLSFPERQLLGLGLDYLPRPQPPSISTIYSEYSLFARRIRLRHFFGDDNIAPSPWFVPNPGWNPPERLESLENILLLGANVVDDRVTIVPRRTRPILPRRMRLALQSLRQDQDIVIKPADKNLGLVIMDRTWYVAEAHRQLSDPLVYLPVQNIPWEELSSRLEGLHQRHLLTITGKEWKFILDSQGGKPCTLYFLPKVYKPTVVGRPICSYIGYIFERASIWLHHQLLPTLLG
jgi:hypothetical protein